MSFFTELKQRNVFKVGVAYALVAWLAIQVADVLLPAYGAPDWVMPVFSAIVFLGFPLALILAWAFELTPEGIKPEHLVDRSQADASIAGRKIDFIIIGIMALAIAFLVVDRYFLAEDQATDTDSNTTVTAVAETVTEPAIANDRNSVAVLPFANRSNSEEDAFFVDGIHDDILTKLAKISSLKVISRTSVLGYRNTTKNMKTIGAELGVDALLEGGVQRAGNQVRINVQLIDTDTDEHLWAETYNRELTVANIFEIQEQIATEIAIVLRAALSPEEQARIKAVPTRNMAALEAYFRGKQRMVERTSEGLAEAVVHLQQAIAIDPSFALAHAGLADAYQLQAEYGGLSSNETSAKAEAAINRALALDDTLAEAYASLGLLRQSTGEFDEAEAAFKRALELNPNYAMTYNWYGNLKKQQGMGAEALALHRKGAELDPLSLVLLTNVAYQLIMLGQFEEGLAQHEKTIEVAPDSPLGYAGMGDYYLSTSGRLDEALRWYQKAYLLDSDNPKHLMSIAGVLFNLGDDQQAECWVERAVQMSPESFPANLGKQVIYLLHGDETNAVTTAEKMLKFPESRIDPISLATIRNYHVRRENYLEARSFYEQVYPDLLVDDGTAIDMINFRIAIDLAAVLQQTGEQQQANWLLDASLSHILYSKQQGAPGYNFHEIHIYALQGDKRKALTALRQAIDEGSRNDWRYSLEMNPNLDSIRSEPEFQAMLEEIKADMSRQLAGLKETGQEAVIVYCP